MAVNSRDALNQLIRALEDHLNLVESNESLDPHDLVEAEDELRDAFFTYDDMLFTEYDVELPLELLDETDTELVSRIDHDKFADVDDELDFEEIISDYEIEKDKDGLDEFTDFTGEMN